MPLFACNVPLVSLIFLKRSLVFPILIFPSISLHYSLRKAFLALLAILWNSVSEVYLFLFFFRLCLLLLFFSQLVFISIYFSHDPFRKFTLEYLKHVSTFSDYWCYHQIFPKVCPCSDISKPLIYVHLSIALSIHLVHRF